MDNLIWSTEKRKVNDLLPSSKNPRLISDKQMADLKKSLKLFNLVEIPAIDTDNKIIAGHQRIKALQLLGRGEELIDVRVPNRPLTDEEYERYLLTSNAVTGDWDYEALKDFDVDFLANIGFDMTELAEIWDSEEVEKKEKFDLKKALRDIKTPTTQKGDLILLGRHKLICGDSTDPNVLKRLFGDDKANMIYSDPVYNIKIDYNGGIGGKNNYGGQVKDDRTDSEYHDFLKRSLENALMVASPNLHVFYWSDQKYIWLIQTLYRELGIENKRVCLWIKNSQNPTPGVAFNKCYEPCTYGTKGKPYLATDKTDLNEAMNNELGTGNDLLDQIGDIWMEKRVASNDYEHATTKPPELHHKAITRCTKPGDIILDSFAGSGSTLIAGEQLKRRVYSVELEPIFCDLIIKRYEALTGLKVEVLKENEEV